MMRFAIAAFFCVFLGAFVSGCGTQNSLYPLPPGVRALTVAEYWFERGRLAGLQHKDVSFDTAPNHSFDASSPAQVGGNRPAFLWADAKALSLTTIATVPLIPGYVLPTIDVSLTSQRDDSTQTLACGIDTGGDFALILSARAAEQLGCRPLRGFDVQSRGIGGVRSRPTTVVASISIGGVEIGPVVAGIDEELDERRHKSERGTAPVPDAILGVQLIERFARVAIDMHAGVMEIDAGSTTPEAANAVPGGVLIARLPWALNVIHEDDGIALESVHRVTPATIGGRAVLAVLDTRAEPDAVVRWRPDVAVITRNRLVGANGGRWADVFRCPVSLGEGMPASDAEVFGNLGDNAGTDAVIGMGVLKRWRVEFRPRTNEVWLFDPS